MLVIIKMTDLGHALFKIVALAAFIGGVRGEFVLTRRPGVRKGHRNAFPK